MPLSRVQPERYEALLDEKVHSVCQLMQPFDVPAPTVYPSLPTGFRQRAEFRMWHDGDAIDYVMFRRDDPKTPVVISTFPIAASAIQVMMTALRVRLKTNHVLRHRLFQVEFLSSLAGELLITLVYHRKLDPDWESAAQLLAEELQQEAQAVSIVGRSRKQKIVIGQDYIQEVLRVHGVHYRYRQYEQSFSQPNARVNIAMIEWACERARGLAGDLLELYCGNGNFTLPLARHFDQVIATEVSKSGLRAARANLQDNDIENVHLVRLSAEETTEAMQSRREFRRLRELPKPLDQFNLDTLFVDPPRAGLDEGTVALAGQFPAILYISCNPRTLARDLETLTSTHRITQFALFDQFPYTDHMECGVLLQRNGRAGIDN
jgi:tRNA (uracil-5-)-methyltransferase